MIAMLLLTGCEPLFVAPAAPPDCDTAARAVVADDPVGDGFTAADILAFASGVFQAEGVEVEVSYDGGRLLVCEEELQLTGTIDGQDTAAIERLDIEVDITLSTSDGRLDEATASAFLSAIDGDWTSTRYTLEDGDVGVWLAWTPDFFEGEIEDRVEYTTILSWPE